MKKGFTLIELLVVIAIIAVLAATLFPAFLQAKQAAKATVTLSNVRQMVHATAMYLSDNDDTMPLAAVLRPDDLGSNGTGSTIGTNLAYPFPYNDNPQASNPTVWGTPNRVNMAACQVNNAIVTYAGSVSVQSVAGTQYGDIFDVVFNNTDTFGGPGIPQDSGLTFNGELHRYNATSIPDPSKAIEWWCGNGNFGWHGRTSVQPSLNCGEPHGPDTCMFVSGQNPNQGIYSPNYPDATFGEDIMSTFNPYLPQSFWIYPSHKAPFGKVDGSVKMLPMGGAEYPNVVSTANNGPWSDPLISVDNGTRVGTAGAALGLRMCNDANTPAPDSQKSFVGAYSCYFRPDRTK